MDRRRFVAAVGAAMAGLSAPSRGQPRKVARVGWVGGWYSQSAGQSLFDAFLAGMRERGYVEGQNLAIEARWMDGSAADEASTLIGSLVQSKLDVLVIQGRAFAGIRSAPDSLPVVFVYSGDPVAARFVDSIARPGGNRTGITLLAFDLAGKRVELLKEAAPRASRLAALVNPLHIGEDEEYRQSQIAANRLGLSLQQYPVRTVAEVNAALEAMVRERVDGIVALSNLLIMLQRSAIAEFAAKHRLPTISGWEDFAADGNLMSYGPNLQRAWHQAATYVDKVLKGAKPADLPVEQPTKFDLVINLRTAKALGLAIAPSLLIRADRVIA